MKPFKIKVRVMPRKERWTKKCKCGSYIPKEYEKCNYCLLDSVGLAGKTTYDALDFLGLKDLLPQDDVIDVIRNLNGETVVRMK